MRGINSSLRNRLIAIAMEIIPSERQKPEIKEIKRIATNTYLITAQDREYDYSVEVELLPYGEDYSYRLLDFDYRERSVYLHSPPKKKVF